MAQTDKSNGERRLAVTAIGQNHPELALDIINGISKRGCQIVDCHILPLADCLSMALLVAGNWSALGRLETALPKLAEQMNIQISCENVEDPVMRDSEYRPYAVEIIAPVRDDLLNQVLTFFSTQDLLVRELAAQHYKSMQTGAHMCTLSLVAHMPTNQHPQALRESFMDLCDELNADGIFDPIKN